MSATGGVSESDVWTEPDVRFDRAQAERARRRCRAAAQALIALGESRARAESLLKEWAGPYADHAHENIDHQTLALRSAVDRLDRLTRAIDRAIDRAETEQRARDRRNADRHHLDSLADVGIAGGVLL